MKLIIFDIDGVLLRGFKALPYAADIVNDLRKEGYLISFLTNNSTQTPEIYSERLINAGIQASPDEVMSSAIATAVYLKSISQKGTRILAVGEKGIIKALTDAGFNVIDYSDNEPVEYVVVGMDRGFNYEKLARAQKEIWQNGAKLIGTNYDTIFPIEGGDVRPGGGVMVVAIEACTRQKATIIGKPEPITLELILDKYNIGRTEAMIVGDNLDTDILAGKRAGIATVFVLSGIHSEKDISKLKPDSIPDFILKDLSTLFDCI